MKWILAGLVALLSAVGLWWFAGQEVDVTDNQEPVSLVKPASSVDAAFQQLLALTESQQWEPAYELMQRYRIDFQEQAQEPEWLELQLQIASELEAFPFLASLYEEHPEAFAAAEPQVLDLARYLLRFREWALVDRILADWQEKQTETVSWFFLASDRLIAEERTAEATELLSARELEGEEEIDRLLRLTMLTSVTELEQAWKYLEAAQKLDPKRIETRVLRGRVLERIEKPMLAHVEFRASLMANPESPVARDQLAHFYRRQGQHRMALTTWGQGLQENSADYLWLSAWFWNKVTIPLVFDWKATPLPEGELTPMISYLLALKPDEFWNAETFPRSSSMDAISLGRQEAYWLQLLAFLQEGREQQALDLLRSNPFRNVSWHIELESLLTQLLSYRLAGELPVGFAPRSSSQQTALGEDGLTHSHIFFQTVDDVSGRAVHTSLDEEMDDELRTLLLSADAFSIALLAAGWHEAALSLQAQEVLPRNYPDWVAYEFARARENNRSREDAVNFIEKQYATPLLSLLQAEILVRNDQIESAVPLLLPLVKEEDAVGYRASVVLAGALTALQDFEGARQVVVAREDLHHSLPGRELLGRIEEQRGDAAAATKIFESISQDSFVAQSYLARQAYDQGDYARARTLTLQMIKRKPDLLELRASLSRIMEAEEQQSQE